MNNGAGAQSSKKPENIVLVGRTGNGKSATGNSLIGKKVFESKAHGSGVTMKCQTSVAETADHHTIKVIDTPGLFDMSVAAEFISKEIVRCLTLAEGGIDAVLLVFSARGPITQEEHNTLNTLQSLFGSKILDHVIIVFTGGDVLEENEETLEEFLDRDCPDFMKEVARLFGNRMVLIDNKTHDEDKKAAQVHKLLTVVDEMRKTNFGAAYTNDIYNEIKDELEKLRQKLKNLEDLETKSKDSIARITEELHAEFEEKMNRMTAALKKKMDDALEAQEKIIKEQEKELREMNERIKKGLPKPEVTVRVCSIL